MRASHEVHVSELRTFSSCRRKWHWAYREGWHPPWRPQFLDFGIAYHKGMEAFYHPDRWYTTDVNQKLERALTAFHHACEQHRQECLRMTGDEPDSWQENIELGEGMLQHYAHEVHPYRDWWFEPVATELSFSMPLGMTCPGRCGQDHYSGAPITFDGTADLLVRDVHRGGLYIVDTKTAKQLSSEWDENTLHLDDQVAFYTMALRLHLGWDIQGFVYAEHRKEVPKPPRELTRLNAGGYFSRDKTQLTTHDLVAGTVWEHDREAFESGVYDEYLDFLESWKAPEFHRRFEITKSKTEMEEARRVLELRAAEMLDSELRIYPEPSKFTCRICPFYDPCLGVYMGEDYQYTLESLFERGDG